MNDGAALSYSRNVIGLIGNRNRGEIIDAEFGATIFHGYVRDLEASEIVVEIIIKCCYIR